MGEEWGGGGGGGKVGGEGEGRGGGEGGGKEEEKREGAKLGVRGEGGKKQTLEEADTQASMSGHPTLKM